MKQKTGKKTLAAQNAGQGGENELSRKHRAEDLKAYENGHFDRGQIKQSTRQGDADDKDF